MKTKLLLALCILTISNAFAQFPFNGLVAQYGFDNGSLADGAAANNLSSSGTNFLAAVDRFAVPPNSNAIDFNGDHFSRSNINFTGTGESASYSFWIKTSYSGSTPKLILSDSNRTAIADFDWQGSVVTIADTGLRIEVRNQLFYAGQNHQHVSSHVQPNLNDGEWHHIAFNVETILVDRNDINPNNRADINIKVSFYTDGVRRRNIDVTPNTDTFFTSITQSHDTNEAIYLANFSNESLSASEKFDNQFDDLLIYNRVLTAAEIQNIASFGDYCFEPSSNILSTTNVTKNSATVNINGTGTYDIAYHKSSEAFSNATIVGSITSGSSNLINLDTFIDYDLYVREQCTGNTTPWSTPKTFRTSRDIGIVYVDKDASGVNNGISWANAYNTVYEAFAVAQNFEQIWIAEGTYTPNPNRRDVGFQINVNRNVSMYGGFTGTETNLTDRVFGTNETILSGDLGGNDNNSVDFNNSTRAENSYQIIQIYNFTNNIVIDGLTITAANANSNGTQVSGGGVFISNFAGGVTISNCKIEKNIAAASGGGLFKAISNTGSSLTISNCIFKENLARNAGGIYTYTNANTNFSISVANSLFIKNSSKNNGSSLGTSGSSMWIRSYGNNSTINATIVNNTFSENTDTGTAQSLNNFNRATLALSETSSGRTVNATVTNCIFWNNSSTAKSLTGLYETLPANLAISNCIDNNNFFGIPANQKTGISTSNPLFNNPANNDYSLDLNSPAIDTGNNTEVIGNEDLANNQRIANSVVDLGCFETSSQPTLNTTVFEDHVFLLRLYPNPTTDELFIETSMNIFKWELIGVNGKIYFQGDTKYLQLSTFSSGIYFLKIYSEHGIITKKIIKK